MSAPGSLWCSCLSSTPRFSFQELSRARLAGELAVVDDDFAAGEDGLGGARDFPAFVGVVVHLHVERLRGEGLLLLGIEDDEVGVRARRDRALAGEEAEDLRGG